MKYYISDYDLIEAVNKSKNYCEVCRYLGIKNTGGNSYERIRNKIKNLNLDVSHFNRSGFSVGVGNSCYKKRKSDYEILKKGHDNRISHNMLKRALLNRGHKYECNKCKIQEWNGQKITLDIEHKDGDWSNCEEQNLIFLCPNCHRQTNTFGGKNIKR